MGLVTDVYWTCPGCGTRMQAQVYGEASDPPEFPVTGIPAGRELKWAPPCRDCKNYELTIPETLVHGRIVRTRGET